MRFVDSPLNIPLGNFTPDDKLDNVLNFLGLKI